MKKYCLIIYILSSLSLFGQNVQEIDLNHPGKLTDPVLLTHFGGSIQYIALETHEKSLIGSLKDIIITDEFIFVQDPNRVLEFGLNGKFIRQIGTQGKGPGEYNQIACMEYNAHNKELWIADIYGHHTLRFDTNGKFLASIHNDISPVSMKCVNVDQIFMIYYDKIMTTPPDPYLMAELLSGDGKSIRKYYSTLKHKSDPGGTIMLFPMPLFRNQDGLFVNWLRNDTLFKLERNELKPYVILNHQKFKMPFEDISVQSFMNREYGGPYYYFQRFILNNDQLFLEFKYQQKLYHALIDLSDGRVVVPGKSRNPQKIMDDIDGGTGFWPFSTYQNKLFDYFLPIDADNLNEFNRKTGLHLTEEDNPVIRILR